MPFPAARTGLGKYFIREGLLGVLTIEEPPQSVVQNQRWFSGTRPELPQGRGAVPMLIMFFARKAFSLPSGRNTAVYEQRRGALMVKSRDSENGGHVMREPAG